MTAHTILGDGTEFDKIRSLLRSFGPAGRAIGDDAVVIDLPAGQKLVASTDTSVDEIHFRRDWISPEEIGYRAAASALSDLAAMGASPLGVLLAISLPQADAGSLEMMAAGAGAAARDSGTFIVGGDLSQSRTLAITATVLGSVERPLLRSAAKEGDSVYVTGMLGGPGLALKAFLRGEKPSPLSRERFVHPRPRINEALWLASNGATACIDISDGMPGDLGQIAAASNVGIAIDTGRLPIFEGATQDIALGSGEEYELCITSPAEMDTEEFARKFGIPLTLIGRVESSGQASVIFRSGGAVTQVPQSFSHFAK